MIAAGCASLGAGQVDLVIQRAAAAGEVAIERPDADRALGGALPLAYTGPAGAFEDLGAGGDEAGQGAVAGEHVEDLAAAGGDAELDGRVHRFAFEHLGDDHQVVERGVGARADDHLVDLLAGIGADGLDVVGRAGGRNERLECGQVDHDPVERDLGVAILVGQAHLHAEAVLTDILDGRGVLLDVHFLGDAVVLVPRSGAIGLNWSSRP